MVIEALPAISNYQIVRIIGAGGMSTVYEAIDTKLKRPVAMKVLHSHLDRDPTARERFRREALAAARMDYPNIVHIYDYLYANHTHCIVMEYVPGPDVESVVRARGPLPFDAALYIMSEVAAALEEAHGQGVLHRDVKPSNILLHRGSRVMLSDFGLARSAVDGRLTQHDAVAGTPCFMSPEQISGGEVEFASDIYSWAVTFHSLLSGRLPYAHQSFPDVVADVQYGRVTIDSAVRRMLPSKYLALLERCLVADPHERIKDAAALREQLAQCGPPPKANLTELMGVARRSPEGPSPDHDISATQIYRASARSAPVRLTLYVVVGLVAAAALFLGLLWYVDRVRQEALPAPLVAPVAPDRTDSVKALEEIVRETVRKQLLNERRDSMRETPTVVSTVDKDRGGPAATATAKPSAADSGQLFVYCQPWANVVVDGKECGRTPLEAPLNLSRGKHAIRLYNDFCEPLTDQVEVLPRTVVHRRYTLKVKPAYQ